MAVSNPRFPHQCRIIRKDVENPLEDQEDISAYEGDFDPMGTDSHHCHCGCQRGDYGYSCNSKETVVYEGKCRSYEKHTTSDRGEVITSYRGLALPLTQDDWLRLGYAPQEGDEIAVDRGAYREYGRVVDINPANFHGTHLTWRYGRD